MQTNRLLPLTVMVLVLVAAGCGSTSGGASGGSITGSAVLSGRPSSQNVLVYVEGSPAMVYTDASGNYTLTGIPAGTYTLNAAMTGYESASQQITVIAGQTVRAVPMVLSVLATSFFGTAPFTTIEDQPFSVTVSAMLGSTVLPTYSGTVMLNSSWGDITPTSVSGFSGGTKTFAAWLNREGPASISFSDTSAPQATSSIAVNVLAIPWRVNTAPAVGAPGSGWNGSETAFPSVAGVNGIYQMLYSGFNGSAWNIGLASSADGKAWTNYAGNPVMAISPTTFYASDISAPSLLSDNGVFKAWFTGYDGTFTRIGYATSASGITWTVQGTPVLNTGVTGSWDYQGVGFPSVIKDNGIYKMWFSGYDGTTWRIGYATSTDGVTWTKYSSGGAEAPVLDVSGSGPDAYGAYQPSVAKDGSVYKMYYTGISTAGTLTIDYATSVDGITWVKSYSNPRLGYLSGSQSPAFLPGSLFLYFSYFNGTDWQIALASYP